MEQKHVTIVIIYVERKRTLLIIWMVNRENIGRQTWVVVLKFFAERTYFTKSQMSTKKQLNIIVNNKQRN